MKDLRRRVGDVLALEICRELDAIDEETGLDRWPGWEPLAFDPRVPPVVPMEWVAV